MVAVQTLEPFPEQIQIATSSNHPAKHTGRPQKAPRSIASCYYCFRPSYSEPTAFLIILFLIIINDGKNNGIGGMRLIKFILFLIYARLPVGCGVTCAVPPYNPHLSRGLSTARSDSRHYSRPLVSPADAHDAVSVRQRRTVSTLHSNPKTNLPALYLSTCSSN